MDTPTEKPVVLYVNGDFVRRYATVANAMHWATKYRFERGAWSWRIEKHDTVVAYWDGKEPGNGQNR